MGKEFGERVLTLLDQQNMSQRDLAKVLGMTEAAISRYIKGDREPKPETIANIATTLRTTSDYLLGLEDNNNSEEMGYPRLKRLIARNADTMSESEKKELISDILDYLGRQGE